MTVSEQHSALVIDIDGTICKIKKFGEDYSNAQPNINFINKLKEYQLMGYRIILFTSRNMNSYKGNIGLINKHTLPVLIEWLKRWDVPYDELILGKPWAYGAGFYVDDKAIRPSEFMGMTPDQIKNIISSYE